MPKSKLKHKNDGTENQRSDMKIHRSLMLIHVDVYDLKGKKSITTFGVFAVILLNMNIRII